MAEPIVYNVTDDLVDRLIGLAPGAKTYEVRHFREKVAAAPKAATTPCSTLSFPACRWPSACWSRCTPPALPRLRSWPRITAPA